MYLVLFKPQEGEKTTAYSFVEDLTLIPKEIILKKRKVNFDIVPSKEECAVLVEKVLNDKR